MQKLQSNQPDSPEDALYHYGNVLAKCPFMSTLDKNDKVVNTLTYGKLFTKCHKLAYNLVTKFKTRNGDDLNPGDRVALAFPSHQADSFAVGFFACLLANLVPIAIEPPDSKNEPGIAQKGFLLRQCSVSVVLTSESCLKSLPRDKDDSSVNISFKGWPIMNWLSIDHLQKPTKNWIPPNIDRQSPDIVSHIEYTVDKDGSVMGAIVSRACMLSHVRVLNSLCAYRSPTSSKEVETTICTIDYRRGVGLWHSIIMPLMNGMHIIQIPNTSPMGYHHPLEWLSVCSKFGAKYAITSARILQVAVLARQRDTVPLSINLSNLRMLLVADGQNPWSLAACDAFLDEFENSGLRAESLSTCAYSTETLTVSIRGPFSRAAVTGRGIMSLSALSDGAVRVENAGSLTSLTLQDLGPVIPTGSVAVLKIDGLPNLCRVDEIGEICLSGRTTGNGYFKLPGKSKHVFEVTPLNDRNQAITQQTYVRSGLLGFLGPSNVIFVCGNRNGLMTVSNRRHNTDDVIATILAVSPSSYVHLGRIAVFSTTVYYDERIIVVAEQKTDSTEDEGFQWMSRVMPCVDKIHDVNIYGFLLVPANTLPTSKDGFVDVYETKQRFFEGMLHPCCVLMCPHSCIPNMPIANKRARGGITSPIISEGRSLEILENETIYLAEYLRVRAAQSPDDVIFTLLSGKGTAIASVTCLQLHRKAEKIAILLEKSGLTAGQHAALIYPPGIDLIASFFACFYIGLIPVPIRPPHPQNVAFTLPTVKMVVDTSKSDVILSNHNIIKILRSKDAETVVPHRLWPSMVDTDAPVKGRLQEFYQSQSSHSTAYLDFGVTTNGILVGIKMSHEAAGSICHSHKIACELYPSRQVAICVDPYCGYGLVMWCLSSIYSGHHTILISPSDVELNPTLWLMAISQYKVRDTFVSYAVLDGCIKECSNSINTLSGKGINLSSLRSCVVVAEERPRTSLISVFTALFSSLGLSNRAVKTTFGCRTNPALCSQSLSSPDPSPLYVDLRALRNDRIKIVQKGSPYSICIIESGTILPGVKVCIVNPETGVSCGLSELGEIWVSSKHNSEGYFCQADIDGDNPIPYNRRFRAKLNAGDDTQLTWARTGYLGFIHKTELIEADGAIHEAIHVVGSMDEALYWRDMRYYPSDIENTISRCHAAIGDCALFTWTNLLVVVVETKFDESVALDLVPLITNAVLNEHQVVVGVAVVVDPGTIPINSRGEKQRMHLRDRFLSDSLNPIYVAYNM
ncbi:uncharacterized protein TRIADDRAFT_22640 [Trichoplax adhaerens]|uniref:AMP-dependent synthetase/ligase domain-containing protein n=1 Tax=Trichoplax adhaerens TaxID=10228 RepID=B3RRX1_TRIAD|nr:hypothetical protein TRIADDRAFT_22640 [Trichoplax adhaerens]EDV26945.1 hypothetical protein TRIADDRAFT_22640 [Trichoplax adhaerens]|eukprot:XP_002110941.1 hypothetical protein TRIADDRAFT_22640 [Trichoplax adhaerens]